jgi:septum formation protein
MSQEQNIRLVLASQSPRRQEMLRSLGLEFDVIPSHIEEHTQCTEPGEAVADLALKKAQAVVTELTGSLDVTERTLVLGSDTLVLLGKDFLGKPTSREDAYQMLVRMSGRCHKVYTGVALIDCASGKTLVEYAMTDVYFRSLDSAEMRAYARTDEPLDKAGGYALQGTAAAFVEKIEGCNSNVIGLPLPLTVRMLRTMGVRVLGMP